MSSPAAPRRRFPGASRDWARFDGPAGTQMVDAAIDAMSQWSASGNGANAGGAFAAAHATDELLAQARRAVARLLGTPDEGVWFAANMTTGTFSLARSVARTLRPGDRIVGTRLDHDANVTPWRMAADAAGAEHVLVGFDPHDSRLDPHQVVAAIDERTRWVTLPGASNLLGTIPELGPVIAAAHAYGARVFLDAVHLAPHAPIDTAALGVDAIATSAYKWYGPHAAALWLAPDLLESLAVERVRPAPATGPRRWETGTPALESLAGVIAAAEYLLDTGVATIAAQEQAVFAGLLEGLAGIEGIRVWGPRGLEGRTPTVAFTIDGYSPAEVATELAAERIAVWAGHSYALEAVSVLGLAEHGGVVRAGVVHYVNDDDVARLLHTVSRLAGRSR